MTIIKKIQEKYEEFTIDLETKIGMEWGKHI